MQYHVRFDVPIYYAGVYVIVVDASDGECEIEDINGWRFEALASTSEAHADKAKNHDSVYVLVFRRPTVAYDIVGHEVFHLLHDILEDKKIAYGKSKEEVYAYFYGFLLEKVIESLLSLHLNLPFEQQHHDSRNIGMAQPGPSDTAVLQGSDDAGQEAEAREGRGPNQDSREE
jgi:hypothetical protein